MKYVVKVKFKTELMSTLVVEGLSEESVSEELHKDASDDKLEDFEILSIEHFIDVEVPRSVN